MPTNVNCTCFKEGRCMHIKVPNNFFGGNRQCILLDQLDPRITKCALQSRIKKPIISLLPPPRKL